jgi:hypothetical protein
MGQIREKANGKFSRIDYFHNFVDQKRECQSITLLINALDFSLVRSILKGYATSVHRNSPRIYKDVMDFADSTAIRVDPLHSYESGVNLYRSYLLSLSIGYRTEGAPKHDRGGAHPGHSG